MDGAALFVRRPDVPTAEFEDELAVMDLRSGSYLAFNRTAAAVWKLLDEPRSLDFLCESLSRRFRVDDRICRPEIARLLGELGDLGVIEARG